MKKVLALALLLLFCTSCTAQPGGEAVTTTTAEEMTTAPDATVETTAETTAETTVPTTAETTAAPTAPPLTAPYFLSDAAKKGFRFSTYLVQERIVGKGGRFAELSLTMPEIAGDYPGIPKINRFFVSREVRFREEVRTELLPSAEAHIGENPVPPYFRSADFYLQVVLGNIISVSAGLNGWAGGVSWAGIEGYTFDLNSGKRLALSDLFSASKAAYTDLLLRLVSEQIMQEIQDDENGSPYFFGEAFSDEGAKQIREAFNPDHFFLAEEGLVIFYDKYDIAPGVRGAPDFLIPYAEIAKQLKPGIRKLLG